MGEEASGADAVRIACARIAANQGDLMLVGGSYNAERPDLLFHYRMGGVLLEQPFSGVWGRQALGHEARGGIVLGSYGCFLVIESRVHARNRGIDPVAHIAAIRTGRCRRRPGEATANARAQLAAMPPADPASTAVISAACGLGTPTQEEQAFLATLGMPARATATALGHAMEPSFPASLALAAIAVQRGRLFAPLEAAEDPMAGPLRQALVTSWGHWRGEALSLVTSA